MILTKERAAVLVGYLTEHPEEAKELFNMPIEEAQAKINAAGYDFDLDELKDFAAEIQLHAAEKNGELNDDDMDAVVGGVTGIEVAIAMGTIYGAYEACKWAWNTGTWLGNKYVNWRRKR